MRLIALVLTLTAALALPAAAGQDDARRAVQSGEARPLSEILSGLRGRYPGRVLDADIAERGRGDWTYGIRLLNPQGRVVELDVDARSGKVLRERGGRGEGTITAPGFAPQSGSRHFRGNSRSDRMERGRSGNRPEFMDGDRRNMRRDDIREERSYRRDDRGRDRRNERGYDRGRDRDRGPDRGGRGRGRDRDRD